MMVLRTFNVKEEKLYKEYKKIMARNNLTVGQDLNQHIAETVKNHSTGNDQFMITQWLDKNDMKAVPAFFSDNQKWKEYANKLTKREFNDLEKKALEIKFVIDQSYTDMQDTRSGKSYATEEQLEEVREQVAKACV